MAYQTTTHTSWFSRVVSSFKGMLAGIIFFLGGTFMLYMNEGDFVKMRGTINEAKAILVPVNTIESFDSSLQGKLIHASAMATTQDILHDSQFGIEVNAIALNKKAEYYQWVEHTETEKREKLGGGEETITTYTYDKQWVDEPVDSSRFQDPEYRNLNRTDIAVNDQTLYANTVNFGAYELPRFLLEEISDTTPMTVDPKETIGEMSVSGNQIYIGENTNRPNVGDVRVTYTMAPPSEISIIAKVNQSTFEPYVSGNNDREFSRLAMGNKTPDMMITDAHEDNKAKLWFIRILFTIVCIIGLSIILEPLSTVLRVIPFLGGIVEFLSTGVAIIIGLSWSLMVIGISWLRFRPLLGGILLLIAVALAVTAIYLRKRKVGHDETY